MIWWIVEIIRILTWLQRPLTLITMLRVHGVGHLASNCGTNDANLTLTPTEIVHYFTWSKDGKLVREYSNLFDSRFVLQSDFSLLIQRLREEDEGTYSCYIMSKPPVETVYNVIVQGNQRHLGPKACNYMVYC